MHIQTDRHIQIYKNIWIMTNIYIYINKGANKPWQRYIYTEMYLTHRFS